MSKPWGTLQLAPIGNCTVSALIDGRGSFVWACVPRVDGDPFFSALLGGIDPARPEAQGHWSIDMENLATVSQHYMRNTPVLVTRMTADDGAALDIIDFAPRARRHGRTYRPTAFVRILRPVTGAPRIRIQLRASAAHGAHPAERTTGSNHIRYLAGRSTMRLTTNAPVSFVYDEQLFRLESDVGLFLGPDEPFIGDVLATTQTMLDDTVSEWRHWVRGLAIPFEWQTVVIRAAIALRLCTFEETGAIVAALTTSIPEFADSGRNWDYRLCWVRDAYYTVQALNRLGALDILENYLVYLRNIVASAEGDHIQPVYGVGLETVLTERIVPVLPGYRRMGPVRIGNQAYEHNQNDAYGQIILSSVQAFLDQRLLRPAGLDDFHTLERIGDRAFALYDQPDAGLWELRTRAHVHTYSALLCWAGCDRLASAAHILKLKDRAEFWAARANVIRERIETSAWNEERGHFAATFGGDALDASLLQMIDLRFLDHTNPRFVATVEALERNLRRKSYMLRYAEADDFGLPSTAFNFCMFWLIETLHLLGRTDEARELFEETLKLLTPAGLLSEDADPVTGELWGNYPQTYSLVGLINCAVLLSKPWREVR